MPVELRDWGWDDFFARQLAGAPDGAAPARLTAEYGGCYGVMTAKGGALASLSGKLKHTAASSGEMPVVGDWVLLADKAGADRLPIIRVLERRSKLSRRTVGEAEEEQLIAANADTIFIVQSLDSNFSPRRLERMLAAVLQSGAAPAVILNKADLCADIPAREAETAAVSQGAPVLVLDSVAVSGYGALKPYLEAGRTLAFIGSSGVGKSTIINNLGAERQRTAAVRECDSKGMHTTTTRRLLRLDCGALLIDTPGMKEFGNWDAAAGLREGFDEVEALALECRFTDCGHAEGAPGCAVQAAIAAGKLEAARLESYRKLKKEEASQRARTEAEAYRKKKAGDKKLSRELKRYQQDNDKRK